MANNRPRNVSKPLRLGLLMLCFEHLCRLFLLATFLLFIFSCGLTEYNPGHEDKIMLDKRIDIRYCFYLFVSINKGLERICAR